ncbi:MAG: cache domain-containing protein [Sulfurospirillum sp.]|nr:cache domain-containing protein [Sulfurospirillum sp.]
MKKSLFRTIIFYTVLLCSLFAVLLIAFFFFSSYKNHQIEIQNIQEEHIKTTRETLQWQVEHYVQMIDATKNKYENLQKQKLKERVQAQVLSMQAFFDRYKDTKTTQEIQEMILASMRNIRFEDGGYYFITRLDGIEVLFDPKKELEGTDMLALRNSSGVYVVKETIELVKKQNEGFYQYAWSKPNSGKNAVQKLSFVKLFEPFGWIVGTGKYMDDIEEEIKKEILENVHMMRFDQKNNNFIFIGQYNGTSLTYPALGTNMLHMQDKNGFYIVQELIKTAKNGGGFV